MSAVSGGRNCRLSGGVRTRARLTARLASRLVAAIVVAALFLPGCWSHREIETLGFVVASGMDPPPPGQEGVTVTLEVAKPDALRSGGGGVSGGGSAGSGTPQRAYWLVAGTGETVFQAVRGAANLSPRSLYFGHDIWLIFGEEAARLGIQQYLDVFIRDAEPRRTTRLLVVRGATAGSFLETEFELETLQAVGLKRLEENAWSKTSTYYSVNVTDFELALSDEGREPAVGAASIIDKSGEPEPGKAESQNVSSELSHPSVKASPALEGMAVFKGDRLVGFLSPSESRGLAWLRDMVTGGSIMVEMPASRGGYVGIEVIGSETELKPKNEDGRLSVEVKVRVLGDIEDTQYAIEPRLDTGFIPDLEVLVCQAIKNEIETTLGRLQKEFDSDVPGFGGLFHRSMPEVWHEVKDNWDEIFKDLEVKVDVTAQIIHAGRAMQTVTNR